MMMKGQVHKSVVVLIEPKHKLLSYFDNHRKKYFEESRFETISEVYKVESLSTVCVLFSLVALSIVECIIAIIKITVLLYSHYCNCLYGGDFHSGSKQYRTSPFLNGAKSIFHCEELADTRGNFGAVREMSVWQVPHM